MTENVFSINEFGVVTKDTSEIKADYENAYKKALGQDLNLDVATPQGQLIQSDTQQTEYIVEEVVKLANQFSPQATGYGLDVFGGMFGYYRKPGNNSVVVVNITGANGVVVPRGTIAIDLNNKEWIALDTGTITNGSLKMEFQSVEVGSVTCDANTLQSFKTPIPQVDNITNPLPATIGIDTETDSEFRTRIQNNKLRILSNGQLESIIDTISQVKNVISCTGLENNTGSPLTIDGYNLKANSVMLSVFGGDSTDIAVAIANKKSPGIAMNGNTNISYYNGVQDQTYQIQRPNIVTVLVRIQYSPIIKGIDFSQTIIKKLIQYVTENPLKIRMNLSSFILANEIADAKNYIIKNFKMSKDNGVNWGDNLQFSITEIPQIQQGNVNVEVA
jgi:uncharacterized phage protein gp47/JayE